MAGTTPNLGLWYPDGTDPISAGDDGLRDLTAKLDIGPGTVVPFGNSGVRSSSIPAPVIGMHSYLQDSKVTESYSGSVWEPVNGPIVTSVKGLPAVMSSDAELEVTPHITIPLASNLRVLLVSYAALLEAGTPAKYNIKLANTQNGVASQLIGRKAQIDTEVSFSETFILPIPANVEVAYWIQVSRNATGVGTFTLSNDGRYNAITGMVFPTVSAFANPPTS